jgi:hypothetical protein
MWTGARVLSRRDLRTQPGVLTPGTGSKNARPKGAVDVVPEIGKTLAKPSVYHNSLPPLQGGPLAGHVPGPKAFGPG